jgi:hypothetical protein
MISKEVTHTEIKIDFAYENLNIGYLTRSSSAHSIYHSSVENFDLVTALKILDALDSKTGMYTASKSAL